MTPEEKARLAEIRSDACMKPASFLDFAELIRMLDKNEANLRAALHCAEQAEIERNQARGLLTVETALREAREIERNEARAQLAAAVTVLKAWWPSVQFADMRIPKTPIPEVVAAFAVVAPMLEKPK